MQDTVTSRLIIPSAGAALSLGWEKMKANFLILFLAVLVMFAFNSPEWGEKILVDGKVIEPSSFFRFVLAAYWLLFLPVINYGVDYIFLCSVRGDKIKIHSIVDGFDNYLNVVLASLLVFGLVGIGLVVFVVPGIYVACRLAFVSYLVMDDGLDPIEAVEASWRITQGHAGKIFRLGIISLLLLPLGLICVFVGIFPAVIWIKASFAAMYLSITQKSPETEQRE